MARCYCRWRAVLICICTPCIFVALLFIYVSILMCLAMNTTSPQTVHFVAPGILRTKDFAPQPKTFWNLCSGKEAFWNQLQLAIDRHYNSILRPNKIKVGLENSTLEESPLQESFDEVTCLNSSREHLDKLSEQVKEFVSYMQRRDYPVLIQPGGVCGAGAKDEKETPLLLLAIKSTMLNFHNRMAIRQTWARAGWVAGQRRDSSEDGGYIRRVFLLAKEDSEEMGLDLSESLQLESERYGDILQWDFKDTFFNLTLKDVLFWSWFSRSCNQTHFVFKGDDDVFVNTPRMITYLRDQLKKPQAHEAMKDFMVGNVIKAAMPNRVIKSKYFVDESFYKGYYPTYAGGGGVVYSGVLAKRLHDISKRVHLFPIDDVYVGMCMIRLNACPIHHPAFLTFDFPAKEDVQPCAYHSILLVHQRNPKQLVRLWAHIKQTQWQCQDIPLRSADKSTITKQGAILT